MTTLSGFYQLPDDAAPAGRTQVEADLLNFLDGQLLYASGTDVPVTAPVNEIVVSSGTAYPVVLRTPLTRSSDSVWQRCSV